MTDEIKILISVTEEKLNELFRQSQKEGFMREYPRKKITLSEKKEAIRWLFNKRYKTDL